jgi:type IV pilus assembly protein PilB
VRLLAIPVERSEVAVSVAMANPLDVNALDELNELTGLEIDPMIATQDDIRESIFRVFGAYDDLGELIGEAVRGIDPNELRVAEEDQEPNVELSLNELREMVEGAPVIRLVNALIARAIASRASDIHIEPENRRVRVRFRVDGLLQEAMIIPKDLQYSLISRVKIMANMDIAERRAPQDGRITLVTQQGEYDFRISTYPSIFGEKIVIRILDKNAARVGIGKLGFQPAIQQKFESMIQKPYGMIITCGPTGSGKTTTLYAALNALNSVERHIITIEDPVEYQLAGIVQGNVNEKAGVTFAAGLRTILRQDPDVVLVGEIRDRETAQIAIEAALTGHLVLSTLHATDAAGAVARLSDMGIEPFLIAGSLLGVCGQRLARQICPKCQTSYEPQAHLLEELGVPAVLPPGFEFVKGRGCEYCNRSGYRGRTGIYELMELSPEVQRAILTNASSSEIREIAMGQNMMTMREDAIQKVLDGITTCEEVARVTLE